ncbi:hypothetical protein A2160_04795 [Candidatus Beckwithbacteria bacterium RBG_13_42_9]|uniref:Uncharacterized protein n=1 Tax=Candidatus Beckwithbacteria bacterium RBG_13_42_9 TaxID=1797457 RepID=A0A1F5E5V2_9BACT|nr:MAG: hypothetical protein A2160_04795 [Candidatus Beckwithbacteria bacterium RBG_13_42_9]
MQNDMKFPLRKIIDYAMTKPSVVDRAYREFFGSMPPEKLKTEWEDLFLEWLIFDYKQSAGTSFLVEYILKNPDKLDKKVIDQFKQIAKTELYSQFEIQEIKKGEWFILEDLYTGKSYKVYEKKGTSFIESQGTIPGRIAQVDKRWYLVGANSVYYPITYTERFKKNLREIKATNCSPKDTVELLIAQENRPLDTSPILTKKQIKNKRKRLRKDYEKNMTKYGLTLTIDDLLKEIYEEDRTNVLDFWQSLIKKGLTEKFILDKTIILQDIWNHFPHKCLKGLSPAEAYAKMKTEE